MEWKPEGDFTEADLWDAIAEAEGVDVSEISDRDLTEFIQRGKKITASPHAYGVGVLFLQEGMIGLRYLGGGKSLDT